MANDDDTFTPATYTRVGEDGKTYELTAANPSDVVRLVFDGWTEKPAGGKAPKHAPAAS